VAVQIIKTVLRMALLIQNKTMLIRPLIPPLDRSLLTSGASSGQSQKHDSTVSYTFTLKRSGRVIRKIEGAPPKFARDWILPNPQDANNNRVLKLKVIPSMETLPP